MYPYADQFFGGTLDPTWPHAILVAGSILGGALVGLGVILKALKIFSVPVAAVFVGVVIEAACTLLLFGFDEGASGAQQPQIIARENARHLDDDQQAAFVAAVKPFAGVEYNRSVGAGSDTVGLMCQLDGLLKLAGWRGIDKASNVLGVTLPCGLAVFNIDVGVVVRVGEGAAKQSNDAGRALVGALNAAHITAEFDNVANASPAGPDVVGVSVGTKAFK